MEVWKDIVGQEGAYLVSNYGNVMSLHYNNTDKAELLKLVTGHTGYLHVRIHGKLIPVHRLVAMAFIPNHNNKSAINHINGNKKDNRSGNLEWCTPSENMQHAWNTGLQKMTVERKKKISKSVICVETGAEYYSIQDASNKTNIDRRNINACCLGARKTAGGYHWRYKGI